MLVGELLSILDININTFIYQVFTVTLVFPNLLFFVPQRISVTHFASLEMLLDAPG